MIKFVSRSVICNVLHAGSEQIASEHATILNQPKGLTMDSYGAGSTGSDDEREALLAQSFHCNARRFPPTPPQYHQLDEPLAVATNYPDRSVPNIASRGGEKARRVVVHPITPDVLRAMLSGGGVSYGSDELPGRVIYRGDWSRI